MCEIHSDSDNDTKSKDSNMKNLKNPKNLAIKYQFFEDEVFQGGMTCNICNICYREINNYYL